MPLNATKLSFAILSKLLNTLTKINFSAKRSPWRWRICLNVFCGKVISRVGLPAPPKWLSFGSLSHFHAAQCKLPFGPKPAKSTLVPSLHIPLWHRYVRIKTAPSPVPFGIYREALAQNICGFQPLLRLILSTASKDISSSNFSLPLSH